MHRLFKTPELVSLICACLDAGYHPESLFIGDIYIRKSIDPCFRRTALVSRQFYLGIVPHLWECTNLSALFKRGLIPAKLEQKGDKTRAYISKSISPKKMSRFRFYAPCIKVLCVYDNEIKVFNWEQLVSFSQNTELLPNLIELSVSLLDQEVFSVFLSRSTRHILVHGPTVGSRRIKP
ncbi:hypothetical protein FRC08_009573 [Ceratobasidium sp. 394]|nr:hypothetical protein FRC08_009573 [Ceratobasidium sp. 394]